MYFLELKNTAHPPIIGALGHSTDCIVKQPKTATIKIDLYSYSPVLCCRKRNSGLSCRSCLYKQSSTLALENFKFFLHSSVMVCAEDLICISQISKKVGKIESKPYMHESCKTTKNGDH